MARLIEHRDVPNSIWNHTGQRLVLPKILRKGWIKRIKSMGLIDKARHSCPKGYVGGESEEETKQHFTWQFSGSCGRTILSFLGDGAVFDDISNSYAKALSVKRLFITDIPCGSGAASLSLLCTVAELRKRKIIPRTPLDVTIVGGDISPHAIHYFHDLLNEISDDLASQSIVATLSARKWNILDPISTSDLVKDINIKSIDNEAHILLVANFSGFLHDKKIWNKSKDQIAEIFRHCRGNNSTAIWIEPQTNNALTFIKLPYLRFLDDFIKYIFKHLHFENKDIDLGEISAHLKHPLTKGKFRTNLRIMHFDIPGDDIK
jgi:hypothetical protein